MSNSSYYNNPEYWKAKRKESDVKQRTRVLMRYSNSIVPHCDCCGDTHMEFLALDHIGGGGSKHSKEIGRGHLYRWIENNNYPAGFRVLCHNCNLSLGHYGYCPHDREDTETP